MSCQCQYTVKNLQFAQTVEPDNEKISEKLSWAQKQRQSGLPTIPSTIEQELETNPFMRSDLPQIQVLLLFLTFFHIAWGKKGLILTSNYDAGESWMQVPC